MGEWRYSSTILDRGTSFTPRSLYPHGKNPRYPLDRRLGGPQSRFGRCEVRKNLLPPAANQIPVVNKIALNGLSMCFYANILTPPSSFLGIKPRISHAQRFKHDKM
jgi:hypothetical protein